MILRKIRLNNIKSYYGEHVLDLPQPTDYSCIHLLGARNGSGKTTLFESLEACLFASESNPILRANFLSRGAQENELEMAVAIEFEHAGDQYQLSRRWIRRPGRHEASAGSVALHSLLQNLSTGETSRDGDQIAGFIDGLIPQSISNFFLFDGEQIQEYTDAAADSVKDALERLLGLHNYIQLLEDLRRVEADFRRERDSHYVREDLNRKIEQRDSALNQLNANNRRRSELERATSEASRELAVLERQEEKIGSIFDERFQARRRELILRRDTLAEDIEDKRNQIKRMISRELVVALFHPQLKEASDALNDAAGPFELEELIGFVWKHRGRISPTLSEASPDHLRVALMSAAGIRPDSSLYSGLSDGINVLNNLIQTEKGKLGELPLQLDDLNSELDRVLHELESLPSIESIDADIPALHQEMEMARNILSRHKNSLADLERDDNTLTQAVEELSKEIAELSSHDSEFKRLDSQLITCRSLQDALGRFITDYRRSRIGELEEVFNEKFRELTNSPEALGKVEIDRETFNIHITSRSDTGLDASEQSAGQKEVMAFALIASVVELSNKQLPMIIDTPLARLDVVHRDNILTNFFPYVGQQVLVLATDAEIGLEQHRRISPHVASEHHLFRDAETGQTHFREGYLVQ